MVFGYWSVVDGRSYWLLKTMIGCLVSSPDVSIWLGRFTTLRHVYVVVIFKYVLKYGNFLSTCKSITFILNCYIYCECSTANREFPTALFIYYTVQFCMCLVLKQVRKFNRVNRLQYIPFRYQQWRLKRFLLSIAINSDKSYQKGLNV